MSAAVGETDMQYPVDMLTIRGKLCIRRTCYRIIRFLLIAGFIVMIVFGGIDKHYNGTHPYVQSDVDDALKSASVICTEFSHCTSNCSTWNDIFKNTTVNREAKCSMMCSNSCSIACQRCQDNCIKEWDNYHYIIQNVGTGTNYARESAFIIIGVFGFGLSLLLPLLRMLSSYRWYGFHKSQVPWIEEQENIASIMILG